MPGRGGGGASDGMRYPLGAMPCRKAVSDDVIGTAGKRHLSDVIRTVPSEPRLVYVIAYSH
jgi:hypothetical protein